MKQSRLVQQSLRSMRRYPLRTILMFISDVKVERYKPPDHWETHMYVLSQRA
jgi:hypothetical protein